MSYNPTQMAAGQLLNPLSVDQRRLAERSWASPVRATRAQLPCDFGLFGDEHLQMDLVEMFQDEEG